VTLDPGTHAPPGREPRRAPALDDEERLRRILAVTGSLPPVPRVAARVTEIVRRDDASVRELEDAVAADPALAARVLATANSVFYSFDQNITTLSHAIVILGFRTVESMALAESSRGLHGAEAWEHAAACAAACRQVARLTGYEPEETAYVAGLLHDVGKSVLRRVLGSRWRGIEETARRAGRTLLDVEREELGFDHAEVGAHIARRWRLSAELVEAIARHQDPRSPAPGTLAAVLVAARAVTRIVQAGLDAGPLAARPELRSLGLDEAACRGVAELVVAILRDERSLPGSRPDA